MNEQQKQNLDSLYSHIEKRLALIGKTSDDYLMIDFEETPDAYLMMQLVEILKFELDKNEKLEAHITELVANLQTQRREYLALETKLKAAQKDAAWQPIETAPKDETLLGFVPHSMGGYLCPIAHSKSGGWFNASCVDYSRVNPSHWKPASYPSIDKAIAGEAT